MKLVAVIIVVALILVMINTSYCIGHDDGAEEVLRDVEKWIEEAKQNAERDTTKD